MRQIKIRDDGIVIKRYWAKPFPEISWLKKSMLKTPKKTKNHLPKFILVFLKIREHKKKINRIFTGRAIK